MHRRTPDAVGRSPCLQACSSTNGGPTPHPGQKQPASSSTPARDPGTRLRSYFLFPSPTAGRRGHGHSACP
ncbi:hypothetical protein BKA80DRAFT_269341 [Phyllosticta citrichinensis]